MVRSAKETEREKERRERETTSDNSHILCRPVPPCAGTCGHMRAHAGICGHVRAYAGMCGHMRVCASMCGGVYLPPEMAGRNIRIESYRHTRHSCPHLDTERRPRRISPNLQNPTTVNGSWGVHVLNHTGTRGFLALASSRNVGLGTFSAAVELQLSQQYCWQQLDQLELPKCYPTQVLPECYPSATRVLPKCYPSATQVLPKCYPSAT
jgi:hypothetical protein